MTMLRVQSLTVMTRSAASMPLFSMAYTSVLMFSPERSNSVACMCTTRGLPVVSFAAIPAEYVSQSCACITSKSYCVASDEPIKA